MATEGPSADEEQRLPLLVWPERVAPTPKSPTISPTDSAKEPSFLLCSRIRLHLDADKSRGLIVEHVRRSLNTYLANCHLSAELRDEAFEKEPSDQQ
jgi:hypothetical protein